MPIVGTDNEPHCCVPDSDHPSLPLSSRDGKMLSRRALTSGFPGSGGVHIEMQMSVLLCEELQEVSSDPQMPRVGVKNAMGALEHCAF